MLESGEREGIMGVATFDRRTKLPLRRYGRLVAPDVQPPLLDLRLRSYEKFLTEGVERVLREANPIEVELPWRLRISFRGAEIGEPALSALYAMKEGRSYEAPLHCEAVMEDLDSGEVRTQRIKLCDLPLMDEMGGFVVSGVRRVVINQIVRCPGVYLTEEIEPMSGTIMGAVRIIPEKGEWLSFFTNENDLLKCRLSAGGRAMSALALLRVYGYPDDGDLLEAFRPVEHGRDFIMNTLDERDCESVDEAYLALFAEMRPGNPPNLEVARDVVDGALFDLRRYDLGVLGRHILNRRYGRDDEGGILSRDDIGRAVREMFEVSAGVLEIDDVDDMANRRVRTAGDAVRNVLAAAMYKMGRESVRKIQMAEKMPERPLNGLSIQIVQTEIASFFNGSKLCQVVDETNPIAELTHKRRVTSLGPGGLDRQAAGPDPRDVHITHYGRLCPIETPEGQNVGLLCTLTLGGNVDELGFMTTPVRRVRRSLMSSDRALVGRRVAQALVDANGVVLLSRGEVVEERVFSVLGLGAEYEVLVEPFVSGDVSDVVYLNAYQDRSVKIAQAPSRFDALGQFEDELVEGRLGGDWIMLSPDEADYVDLSPRQIVSASTSLIPFLDHNDGTRALMGCNMQRQAVPLVEPQTALVTTGGERLIAKYSGYLPQALEAGKVVGVDAKRVLVENGVGEVREYGLRRLECSSQFTVIDQQPVVSKGDVVEVGDALATGPAIREGELALGQRVLVGYMSWEGYNFEDAIILSESVVQGHKFRSRAMKKFKCAASSLVGIGDERITPYVHDVAPHRLRHLGEDGIVRVGSYVKAGDVLVGKETPRLNPAQRRQTPEDKLLQKIFGVGEEIRFVNSSLALPKGKEGRVVGVRVTRPDDGTPKARTLDPAWHTHVVVEVCGTRNVESGDKMSGRHGNKGCVSRIFRQEDMPYMADGRPLDVMLSPLGVPSRMNLGQLMEVHLGWAAHRLGFRAVTPTFDSATWTQVEMALAQAWLMEHAGGLSAGKLPVDDVCEPEWDLVREWCEERGFTFDDLFSEGAARDGTYPGEVALDLWMSGRGRQWPEGAAGDYQSRRDHVLWIDREYCDPSPISGKQWLRDGRDGEMLEYPVSVGYKYMLKLVHMVGEKAHARSTGPYSSITQQPLGGKSNGGGQRLGEMEVWALEGYSAAHTLREMLTIKSDDVEGRYAVLEAIMSDNPMRMSDRTLVNPDMPEAFWLLAYELRAMGLDLSFFKGDEQVGFGTNEGRRGMVARPPMPLEELAEAFDRAMVAGEVVPGGFDGPDGGFQDEGYFEDEENSSPDGLFEGFAEGTVWFEGPVEVYDESGVLVENESGGHVGSEIGGSVDEKSGRLDVDAGRSGDLVSGSEAVVAGGLMSSWLMENFGSVASEDEGLGPGVLGSDVPEPEIAAEEEVSGDAPASEKSSGGGDELDDFAGIGGYLVGGGWMEDD